MVCPPVWGNNPRALARGLSPVQADKLWYNWFLPPYISVDLATWEVFRAETGVIWQVGIILS